MKRLIRKMLVGDHMISEYSTVTVPDGIQEKVYLEVNGQVINISQQHWLLCIEPVVFGIWIEKPAHKVAIQNAATCKLYFNSYNPEDSGPLSNPMEAALNFTRIQAIEEEAGTLFLLKLEKSHIHQLNGIKRYLIFRRYYKKNGLTFPQFKSFVAAYSYPRRIRVVSFRQDDYYNIFPMDLLGDISNNRYIFGLRHSNVALNKIIATGKLVVSEAPYGQKETIYRLGAHHSSAPPPLNALPFKVITSKKHGFYVPEWALSYREVDVLQTINLGSHMLIWGATTEEHVLQAPAGHLYLIHFLHHLYQQEHGFSYPLI